MSEGRIQRCFAFKSGRFYLIYFCRNCNHLRHVLLEKPLILLVLCCAASPMFSESLPNIFFWGLDDLKCPLPFLWEFVIQKLSTTKSTRYLKVQTSWGRSDLIYSHYDALNWLEFGFIASPPLPFFRPILSLSLSLVSHRFTLSCLIYFNEILVVFKLFLFSLKLSKCLNFKEEAFVGILEKSFMYFVNENDCESQSMM